MDDERGQPLQARTRPSLVVAISSFRNDDAVEALIERAEGSYPGRIDGVIVVDSLPTGRIPQTIEQREWTFVQYRGFPENLGSAGNLAERLRIAAGTGAKYVYAVNHDGVFDAGAIEVLVAEAERSARIGAVYPLRRMRHHGGRFDLTGRWPVPPPFTGRRLLPATATTPVYWSSSNCALYALDPVRAGLLPRRELWMGWEDLGYGLELHRHGYRQVVVTAAVVDDSYEYRARPLGPVVVHASEKPSWYTYYRARNLLLVARWIRPGRVFEVGLAARVVLDLVLAVAIRDRKWERLRMYCAGVLDGIRGVGGKWRLP